LARSNMFKLAVFVTVLALAQASGLREEWASFKSSHGKRYSAKEDTVRFNIWAANKKMVDTHNAEFEAGKQTYWMAIYEHSDWTQEEFEERMLGAKVPEDMSAIPVGDFEPLPNAPSHLDYREEGKVTPVKNQGQCGSCWAFSATGALEGMWKQNRGELISMSEQQGVDCGQGSCNGGWMYWFWETVRNGIESESTYPYTARDGSCHANSNNFVATNSGDRRVSQSESALESALVGAGHPVSVTVHVGSSFQHYSGGVFSDPQCQYGQLNHAILAVGYEKSGSSYWMVKNSWGSSWGSQGYINMKIGENSCGIANAAMSPIL